MLIQGSLALFLKIKIETSKNKRINKTERRKERGCKLGKKKGKDSATPV